MLDHFRSFTVNLGAKLETEVIDIGSALMQADKSVCGFEYNLLNFYRRCSFRYFPPELRCVESP